VETDVFAFHRPDGAVWSFAFETKPASGSEGIEHAVAASLWDLSDSWIDGLDNYAGGFGRVWQAFTYARTNTFREFWDNWRMALHSEAFGAREALAQNGFVTSRSTLNTASISDIGADYVHLCWTTVNQADLSKIEVHKSTTANFIPSAATLWTTITDTRTCQDVTGLSAVTTYYFELITSGRSGFPSHSNQVSAIPGYYLTISAGYGGDIQPTNPAPGSYPKVPNSNVTVQAISSACYNFDHWTLDGNTVLGNPIIVPMTRHRVLAASFMIKSYTLSMSPTTGGTTNPASGSSYSYSCGTTIQVSASPNAGNRLGYWTLDGANSFGGPISVTMDSSHTLTANFVPASSRVLFIEKNPPAGGSTNPLPGTYTYAYGSSVQVTASGTARFSFSYWTLDGTVHAENPIIVTMNTDHRLIAYFDFIEPPPPPDPCRPPCIVSVEPSGEKGLFGTSTLGAVVLGTLFSAMRPLGGHQPGRFSSRRRRFPPLRSRRR
jgi:hypothetical protein